MMEHESDDHISWEEDSLAIRFGHMKNDQDGTRHRDARHNYANPFLPEICPILYLAIYAAKDQLLMSLLVPLVGHQPQQFVFEQGGLYLAFKIPIIDTKLREIELLGGMWLD
ncbi:hypothetical protein JG688_00017282 [Phytophthora aleatoria]|uniref:Uncharacterized protein n=1 Tax=Phytophthora aleatoria TaxID=2496075 RepID=A0A8J5IE43_9STRA|nr:hypothetical protein JG688_00017282 [Phytophthora aleatoria]